MKKKIHKKQITTKDSCNVTRPPWELNRTKKDSYFAGINEGWQDGYNTAKRELQDEKARFQERAVNARVEMLRSIATITDAASRALLSYNNNL